GGDVAFARQVTRGNITANFTGNLSANLNANADIVMAIPSYVFATPVLGGQAAVALIVPMGRNNVSVDATLNAAVGPFGFAQTGQEFNAVLGFTYNFQNQSTQYQNGVDMHLDWATSKFITKQWQIGLVGYVYNQLSCDTGAGDRVGCFESRVMGAGPQIGYSF